LNKYSKQLDYFAMGGGKGGSDDPQGKSDAEVMRFASHS
jgi:glutamate dehydrogenase/leucine dehydrogenase